MRFDGLGAHVQKKGDFLCVVAFRNQLQDFTLPGRQFR